MGDVLVDGKSTGTYRKLIRDADMFFYGIIAGFGVLHVGTDLSVFFFQDFVLMAVQL